VILLTVAATLVGMAVTLVSDNRTAAARHLPAVEIARPLSQLDPNQRVDVVIDNANQYQTLAGFGATNLALWYPGAVGDTLGSDLRASAIEAAYGRVKLTTGQISAGLLESPGDYNQRSNDNDDPLVFNRNGFQTGAVDAAKRLLLDQAAPYGFDDYYLAQSVNVRWSMPWLRELRDSDYPRYLAEIAENVAAGALYWRDTYGIVRPYLMLFNEPLSGNRELDGGSDRELADIVKAAGARLRQEGFGDTKFVIPNEETVDDTLRELQVVLDDPDARQYIGAIGYHAYPYGSTYADIPTLLRTSGAGRPDRQAIDSRNALRDLGARYGIPVWMTEVSHGNVDPRSFDSLRGRAIHIHDELVYANASMYLAMLNMWDTTSQREHHGDSNLFDGDNEGHVVLIDNARREVVITGMGYAIGHYARWLQRGAVRIAADSSDSLLQVVAFRDDQQKRLIIILINNATEARDVHIRLSGITPSGAFGGEQSTRTAYWEPLPSLTPESASSLRLLLPGLSVTTAAGPIGDQP
jgi:O-glycosyl hydrolase